MAQLIGFASLLSGLWFLLGMPIVVVVFAVKWGRTRHLPVGLPVAGVMLGAFYACALSLWRLFLGKGWTLSFLTTLDAAGNSAKYGHPVEHRAEVLVVWLLIASTLAAAAAGGLTAVVYRVWIRRRLPAE